jgi:hypothetical protein
MHALRWRELLPIFMHPLPSLKVSQQIGRQKSCGRHAAFQNWPHNKDCRHGFPTVSFSAPQNAAKIEAITEACWPR